MMYEEYNEHDNNEPPRKKGGFLKKAVLITAGAVLFGLVSGGVMVGVNVAASGFLGDMYAFAQASSQNSQETAEPAQSPSQAVPAPAPATDVSEIVEQAMPSVVAITSTTVYQNGGFNWFFGGGSQTYEVPSSGSGIIIGENDSELLIVTNNHVVEGASSLKVAFVDNEAVDAAIKGTDPDTDLAVIAVPLDQIKPETKGKIQTAKLGSSDDLKVGQGVVAIGNALGYGQSVTVGYVSALNREVRVSQNSTRTLLQTDAAINPGNSGGALLNMKGEVVGINAAKYSSTEVEGIGYAIPISLAQDIMSDLMNRKTQTPVAEAERGYLGIQGTNVTEESAKAFDMPQGAYVYKILENGAAAESELREKDIITKADGRTIRSMTELQECVSYYKMGDTITLTIQRQENGRYVEKTVEVTLKAMPSEEP